MSRFSLLLGTVVACQGPTVSPQIDASTYEHELVVNKSDVWVGFPLAQTGQDDAHFGANVSGAGDVNGDGYGDALVFAPDADMTSADRGRMYFYRGGHAQTMNLTQLNSQASIVAEPATNIGAQFGFSGGGVGDINCDGLSDVVVGAPGWENGTAVDEGRIFVYLGHPSNDLEQWTPADDSILHPTDTSGSRFGAAVAAAGDIDGDGCSDVIVGAPGSNEVFVYLGDSTDILVPSPFVPSNSSSSGDKFAGAVAGAGDVNGDGFDDVVVGAPGTNGNTGAVFVYYGSGAGLGATGDQLSNVVTSNHEFGYAVSGIGDFDGDGYADIAASAPGFQNEGRVFLHFGTVAGITAFAPKVIQGYTGQDARLGEALAGLGDINLDGYPDFAVGTPDYDNGLPANMGKAVGVATIYYGNGDRDLTFLQEIEGSADYLDGRFGSSIAAIGDADGDRMIDMLIGAPFGGVTNPGEGVVFPYISVPSDPSEFESIASTPFTNFGVKLAVGDIDDDGCDDIVGSDPDASSGDGQVAVMLSQCDKTFMTPAWNPGTIVTGARFGSCLAVGDVNGDRYADLVVGMEGVGDGVVRIISGSASGLVSGSGGIYAELSAGIDSQADSGFGTSCAIADIDGDGIKDVVVGAPSYDFAQPNHGRLYVYYGHTNGISTVPDYSNNFFGSEVSGLGTDVVNVGDFNLDGLEDIAASAPQSLSGKGRIYAFEGSDAGLGMPVWLLPGALTDTNLSMLAGAGDVNADGRGDLVIGAPTHNAGAGQYQVFGGERLDTLSVTPYGGAQEGGAGDMLGFSVATGYDMNGDGADDVVAASPGKPGAVFSWGIRGAANMTYAGFSTVNVPDDFGTDMAMGDFNGDGIGDVVASAIGVADNGVHISWGIGSEGLGKPIRLRQFDSSLSDLPKGALVPEQDVNFRFGPVTAHSPSGGKLYVEFHVAPASNSKKLDTNRGVCDCPLGATCCPVGEYCECVGPIDPGSAADLNIPMATLSAVEQYRWRARIVQPLGDYTGRWIDFGGNASRADFSFGTPPDPIDAAIDAPVDAMPNPPDASVDADPMSTIDAPGNPAADAGPGTIPLYGCQSDGAGNLWWLAVFLLPVIVRRRRLRLT